MESETLCEYMDNVSLYVLYFAQFQRKVTDATHTIVCLN